MYAKYNILHLNDVMFNLVEEFYDNGLFNNELKHLNPNRLGFFVTNDEFSGCIDFSLSSFPELYEIPTHYDFLHKLYVGQINNQQVFAVQMFSESSLIIFCDLRRSLVLNLKIFNMLGLYSLVDKVNSTPYIDLFPRKEESGRYLIEFFEKCNRDHLLIHSKAFVGSNIEAFVYAYKNFSKLKSDKKYFKISKIGEV